ncbi:MAG: histidine kinase, partial [candidate division Zixibacteria bacterium]|nr:histidine kinase [candidate division Zixibacteria bacterium]
MDIVGISKDIEIELQKRTYALTERVKELEFIHSFSDLLRVKYSDLGEIMQRIAELLPTAFQYPEMAFARIFLKGREFKSKNHRKSSFLEHADIIVENEKVGLVEAGYVRKQAKGVKLHFLNEEKNLLIIVAQRLAEVYSLDVAQSQLLSYQMHLRSLALELTLAEERERRQLALHLHDNIGQSLAVTKLKLETLRHTLPEEYKTRTEDIILLVQQIIADTRIITAEISPPILYELKFEQALKWLGDNFRKQLGLDVKVDWSAPGMELAEGVKVMMFRSIRELLTNVVKHARATSVQIRIQCEDEMAHVYVADNGIGFDADHESLYSSTGGFGLFSIGERFTQLGGRMVVDSKIGKGTTV